MGRKTRQNKITSPELIAQINPKNIRLMNDFLEYLRSIGKADSTVKAYTCAPAEEYVVIFEQLHRSNLG